MRPAPPNRMLGQADRPVASIRHRRIAVYARSTATFIHLRLGRGDCSEPVAALGEAKVADARYSLCEFSLTQGGKNLGFLLGDHMKTHAVENDVSTVLPPDQAFIAKFQDNTRYNFTD